MIVIVMGVSGSGKTSVGRLLAERLGWDFYDADDFHAPANIAKMSMGVALTDEDRADWLLALANLLRRLVADQHSAVLACSALKHSYRQKLRVAPTQVQFVYLQGEYDLIWQRMQARAGHYMKPELLASQFAALEEPPDALTVSIARPLPALVDEIIRWLGELEQS